MSKAHTVSLLIFIIMTIYYLQFENNSKPKSITEIDLADPSSSISTFSHM